MKYLILLLIPLSITASAPKKYTAEQLKELKPPLAAQQYTLKPKAAMPSINIASALAAIPEVQSPGAVRRRHKSPKKKRGHAYLRAPNNSVDLTSRLNKDIKPPFPEIVIKFEVLKEQGAEVEYLK